MASMSATVRRPPPTDGEGHEALLGGAGDHVVHDAAAVGGRGDVEEDELVGPLGIVGLGGFDGITGIAQFEELDPFHHATGMDVQTWNDSARQHRIGCRILTQSSEDAKGAKKAQNRGWLGCHRRFFACLCAFALSGSKLSHRAEPRWVRS
jgi:hypothetical protein